LASVLVTGGQGFIGSAICSELLERGDAVRVLDLVQPSFPGLAARGILVAVALSGIDRVFHLAAQTLVGPAAEDPLATFRSNVQGTWTVLEGCRLTAPEAVVVASSDKAYGPSRDLPYREDQPLEPAAIYEASKSATDVISRSYFRAAAIPVAVTRLANVYGGGDLNFSRLIPELMAAAVSDREPRIRSDGTPRRDFLHVSDAVAAYIALADALATGRGVGRPYNAGTGIPRSVSEVIEATAGITGKEFGPTVLGEGLPDGEIDDQYVDPTKLRELTGWGPQVELEQGLREAFEWYRSKPELCP
jgi:CDP-glucose 4,6-dehydratase